MSRDDGLQGQDLLNYHLQRMKEDQECDATTVNRQNSGYSHNLNYEERNIVSQMISRQAAGYQHKPVIDQMSSNTNILGAPKTVLASEHYGVGDHYMVGTNQSEANFRLKYEHNKIHLPLAPLNVRKLDSHENQQAFSGERIPQEPFKLPKLIDDKGEECVRGSDYALSNKNSRSKYLGAARGSELSSSIQQPSLSTMMVHQHHIQMMGRGGQQPDDITEFTMQQELS